MLNYIKYVFAFMMVHKPENIMKNNRINTASEKMIEDYLITSIKVNGLYIYL